MHYIDLYEIEFQDTGGRSGSTPASSIHTTEWKIVRPW